MLIQPTIPLDLVIGNLLPTFLVILGEVELKLLIDRYVPKTKVAQSSQLFMEKTEQARSSSSVPSKSKASSVIPQSQFQQSHKKIEEMLAQRLEREKMGRKGCLVDGEVNQDIELKMVVQKHIQQKLQADLQKTVKQIQEKQSIELRLPQNRRWTEVGQKMHDVLIVA